ncbi:hypothetical protein PLICRDRAFT_229406 [Plicaturopsis crispa FD-325 SS-3]|nr:hypothetical protein PLICRDRAFT_229406 [Plicaturopsis crispa FD-325 SS-3]
MADSTELGFLLDLDLTRICTLITLSAAVYDHVLTFDEEVEFIWRKNWSYSKIIFLVLRYFGEALMILNTAVFTSVTDVQSVLAVSCRHFFTFQAWSSSVIIWAMQIVLQWRIHALYGGSRIVIVLLSACFGAEVASNVIILSLFMAGKPEQIELGPVQCAFVAVPPYYFGYWVAIICFETVLFLLALWIGIQHVRQVGTWSASHILHVLLRDSLSYFLAALIAYAACAGVWIMGYSLRTEIPENLALAVTVILGAHMILNLRAAYWLPFSTRYDEASALDHITVLRTMPRPYSAAPPKKHGLRLPSVRPKISVDGVVWSNTPASSDSIELARRLTGEIGRPQAVNGKRDRKRDGPGESEHPQPPPWRWDERSGRLSDCDAASVDAEPPEDVDDALWTLEREAKHTGDSAESTQEL